MRMKGIWQLWVFNARCSLLREQEFSVCLLIASEFQIPGIYVFTHLNVSMRA